MRVDLVVPETQLLQRLVRDVALIGAREYREDVIRDAWILLDQGK
jgi:hypothetical protein